MRHSSTGTIILAIYIDDIVVTGNDHQGITQLKAYLSSHFHMKDIGLLMYFLGSKIVRSSKGLSLSQKKYLTDFLEETAALEYNLLDSHMNLNICLD